MYLRMTDLLVDLLDRYEPEPADDEPSEIVNEEAAGVASFGQWTVLADSPLEESEEVRALFERLELAEDEDFQISEGAVSFNADALSREDLLEILETIDAACDVLEVSGELDVHERSLTWMGEGAALEPMPMPLPRPDDEIPLLVEEFAIHLQRHEAGPESRSGGVATYAEGIELFGRPYLLLRDEIEDPGPLLALLTKAGVPEPAEAKVHRVEWAGDGLKPSHVYKAVHALRDVNPAVGFAGGVTWRNEALQVEEPLG